jgi:hypothetical protein
MRETKGFKSTGIKTVFLALGFICLLPGHLSATSIIYNDFGEPGNTASSGFWIDSGTYIGTTFTATGSGDLSSVLLDVESLGGSVSQSMGLYSNVSGEPGSLLESWTVTVPANSYPTVSPITLTSVGNLSLTAGTTYWFVIDDGAQQDFWLQNNQSVSGGSWAGDSLTDLSQISPGAGTPVIQLDASSVVTPEPASGMLLLLGFAVFVGLRRLQSCNRLSRAW